MPRLFSYGTLQIENVQLSTFGRRLQGQPDELPQFEPSQVPAAGGGFHANVTFNGRSESRVKGTVYEITDTELSAADQFEQTAAYIRIAVTLASGKQAWVYIDGHGAGSET